MIQDAQERKNRPVCTGVVDYFPDALQEVARVSQIGNDQHNPGQPLHWDKSKSTDEADALLRHLMDRGKLDTDGMRHSAKVAWRALALLQRELDAEIEAGVAFSMGQGMEKSTVMVFEESQPFIPRPRQYLMYVSGPYRAPTPEQIQRNVDNAAAVAAELWKWGYSVICPHLNTHEVARIRPEITGEEYVAGDLTQVERCDAVVFLPGWSASEGTLQEMVHARSLGIPVIAWTEIVACGRFMEDAIKLHILHSQQPAA